VLVIADVYSTFVHVDWKAVQSEGGFDVVTRNCAWNKMVKKIGYEETKNIASMLCRNYEKILYPYDIFISGATTASKVHICVKWYWLCVFFLYLGYGNIQLWDITCCRYGLISWWSCGIKQSFGFLVVSVF